MAPTGRLSEDSSSFVSDIVVNFPGVPHTAIEDGFIAGYFIPKGSMILVNLWLASRAPFLEQLPLPYVDFRNMLHDPETYPDPFTFDPERHIASPGKEAQKDPRKICFGYGRRICPGMYLAEASLYSCVAMSLAVFDIEKAVENGVPITPVHENTSGIIRFVSDLILLVVHLLACISSHLTS